MPTDGHSQALDALRQFDSCTLSNAIERFNVRPRNEGYISGAAACRFPNRPPVVGHAVTARIRSYMPPVTGKCYFEHIEWWRYVETIPAPRIIVLQDFDPRPGFGGLFGEVHARISRALQCVACVTNGAVRDLTGIDPLGFQLFSSHISVSHAYAHIVDFGNPIEIGGLEVKPGDVLHGDRNGVLSIPAGVVEELPKVAQQLKDDEEKLFELISRPGFNVDALDAALQNFAGKQR